MNRQGLTLIELLIVIVVTALIAGFTIVAVGQIVDNTKEKADLNNLSTLNTATENYVIRENINTTDAFDGIASDYLRIQELLLSGYIDQRVIPQQDNATFGWNVDNQRWQLFIDGNPYSVVAGVDFSTMDLQDAIFDGVYTYQDNNITYNESNGTITLEEDRGKVLLKTDEENYSFTIRWSSENNNTTKISIVFDYHDDTNIDAGEGYFILLRRDTNFVRLRRITNGSSWSTMQTTNYSSLGVIPRYQDDPDWYLGPHDTTLVVTRVNATTKNVAVYVDGEYLEDFDYTQTAITTDIYFGITNQVNTQSDVYIHSITKN